MNNEYLNALRKCDGILFDFNGTLSDDEWVLENAYDKALQNLGLNGLEVGEYDTLVGLSDPDIASSILHARSASEKYDALIAQLAAEYTVVVSQTPTITDESTQFVRVLLSSEKEVAVVTGTFRALMQGGLDQAGIGHIGEQSVTIEDVSNGKPDPEGFLLGAEKIGVPADRIIGFEDSKAGAEALAAAGMKAVGIGPHLENFGGLIAHFPTMTEAASAYLNS